MQDYQKSNCSNADKIYRFYSFAVQNFWVEVGESEYLNFRDAEEHGKRKMIK